MQFWPINLILCYLGSGFNKEGKINEAASCSPRLRSESVRESEGPKSQRGGVGRGVDQDGQKTWRTLSADNEICGLAVKAGSSVGLLDVWLAGWI